MEGKTTPAGFRLRKGRVSENGRIYLVTMVCQGRKPLFAPCSDGRLAVQGLRSAGSYCDTLCFVVMPDHVHWMLQLGQGAELSRCVQKAKALTTRALRMRRSGVDDVWQRGFHDRALRRDEDVRKVARYVIGNPLRAGLVEQIGDYPLWDAVWL